ncbi:hypothetical protein QMK19_03720 [Streptomyces sp. H10-C2]|uniref:hypothetical protein n=1 Tax=unclassified Streptomyces TaxID=2593676 RepID=UPI0024BA45DC|nr:MULTISPECIES: hypothetical protein [unclassified Streptomyces]MDJ0342296.1 hypothetical protein [Streptomyces sp. PH10-H1]MDJ0368810.1 hypothetical protein [Streptomyces sp. H10-C2]
MFTAGFAKLTAEGEIRGRLGLEELARAVEKQAKINASNGRHAYGTRTTARPGEGPAVISGNLKRSVGHSPIMKDAGGWKTKVGPRVGFTPPYGRRPTEAHRYGYALETGLRNGAKYPWLKPAAQFATKFAATVIFNKAYGTRWKRVF